VDLYHPSAKVTAVSNEANVSDAKVRTAVHVEPHESNQHCQITELAGVAITLWAYIRMVLGSDLGGDTNDPEVARGCFPGPSGKGQDSAKTGQTFSLHTIPISSTYRA
jgi:hypothetical protein